MVLNQYVIPVRRLTCVTQPGASGGSELADILMNTDCRMRRCAAITWSFLTRNSAFVNSTLSEDEQHISKTKCHMSVQPPTAESSACLRVTVRQLLARTCGAVTIVTCSRDCNTDTTCVVPSNSVDRLTMEVDTYDAANAAGRPQILAEPSKRVDGLLVDALGFVDDELETVPGPWKHAASRLSWTASMHSCQWPSVADARSCLLPTILQACVKL